MSAWVAKWFQASCKSATLYNGWRQPAPVYIFQRAIDWLALAQMGHHRRWRLISPGGYFKKKSLIDNFLLKYPFKPDKSP